MMYMHMCKFVHLRTSLIPGISQRKVTLAGSALFRLASCCISHPLSGSQTYIRVNRVCTLHACKGTQVRLQALEQIPRVCCVHLPTWVLSCSEDLRLVLRWQALSQKQPRRLGCSTKLSRRCGRIDLRRFVIRIADSLETLERGTSCHHGARCGRSYITVD